MRALRQNSSAAAENYFRFFPPADAKLELCPGTFDLLESFRLKITRNVCTYYMYGVGGREGGCITFYLIMLCGVRESSLSYN